MAAIIQLVLLVFMNLGTIFAQEKPICESCECHGTVINCQEKVLSSLPVELSLWPHNTEEADFSGNVLTRVEKVPKLDRLYSLSFRHNRIWNVGNSAFADLEKLEKLDLGHNQLSSLTINANILRGRQISKTEYDILSTLRVLKLDYNTLTSLQSIFFVSVPHLTELYLGGNEMRSIDESTQLAIESLLDLEVLDLSCAALRVLPQRMLSKLRKLRVLDLSGNEMTSVPSELRETSQLEELRLSRNPLRAINQGAFPASLASLRTLVLAEMGALTRVGERALAALTGLRALRLTDCPGLTEVHALAFRGSTDASARLPALQQLILRGNSIKTLSSDFLPHGDDLTVVDLRDNKWICECNIRWFLKDLEPIITQNTPELLTDVICAGPSKLSGHSVFSQEVYSYFKGGCKNTGYIFEPNFIVALILSTILLVVAL